MTDRLDASRGSDILARGCLLAERRLQYLTELFESGRWRRFHSEPVFLENMREAKTAVQIWRNLMAQETSRDTAVVSNSWIARPARGLNNQIPPIKLSPRQIARDQVAHGQFANGQVLNGQSLTAPHEKILRDEARPADAGQSFGVQPVAPDGQKQAPRPASSKLPEFKAAPPLSDVSRVWLSRARPSDRDATGPLAAEPAPGEPAPSHPVLLPVATTQDEPMPELKPRDISRPETRSKDINASIAASADAEPPTLDLTVMRKRYPLLRNVQL
jgi:uncharacterized repeat protein (TIGR03809 family)